MGKPHGGKRRKYYKGTNRATGSVGAGAAGAAAGFTGATGSLGRMRDSSESKKPPLLRVTPAVERNRRACTTNAIFIFEQTFFNMKQTVNWLSDHAAILVFKKKQTKNRQPVGGSHEEWF